MEKICILNFNNTYENQDFYKNKNYEVLDLSDLKSVSRYCDEKSLEVFVEKICILNFNNTYENQDFYKNKNYEVLDLSDLKSVSRYCDEKSLNIIRKRIGKFCDAKIKFIDSGNYHYVSYLMLEKIKEPFVLVLFDHHTDMQPSFFKELMSCGCWVKKTLDDNRYIEKVIIIGAKESLIKSIDKKY